MLTTCRNLILLLLLTISIPSAAQRIFYTEADKDDYRQMNFEIIGRVGGNINVYKNFRARHDLSVYDNEMKLKSKTRLEFLPERVLNLDFVVYQDFYWMIYQYQKKNVVYCSVAKMDGNGKLMEDPIDIDTSHISGLSDNKIYSMINSDDKKQIMVFKINRRNEKKFLFTLLRFNSNMKMEEKNVLLLDMPGESIITEFVLDNEGELVFGRSVRSGSGDYIKVFDIISKRPNEERFTFTHVPLPDKSLDEIKIKPDNLNRRFIVNSFYYKQKKGNIDGIYNLVWDKADRKIGAQSSIMFGDTLRADAKSENIPMKQAFNDYFIKQVIPKRDGGFVVFAELYYTTSRGGTWNRWDYLYGYNYFNPLNYMYYSPFSSMNYWRWTDPYNRFGMNTVRHYSENVVVMAFDANAQMQWSNVVRKNQFDDNTDMYLSYQIFNTGAEVKFLFNTLERRELILASVSLNPDGQQKREPTMRNLDQNYQFMPRYGKQVGARQIVLPCMYKNYICFAKLDF
ncbi:MAG: hypothetical protein ACK4V4_08815 [Sphingobacteriales bacterium]|jgi:hypothetical protein